MNPTECKFCGFTENTDELCSICGNRIEHQKQPDAFPSNPPAQTAAASFPITDNRNINQYRPVKDTQCANCGALKSPYKRICVVCEEQEKKTGFSYLRLAIILFPLAILLLFTFWFSFSYLEEPDAKAVRDFETVTGITKDLHYDNYRLSGTSVIRIKSSEPNERGRLEPREHELAFEMIFTKTDQFYVHFYRDPKETFITNTAKTVYQAGSNGYRRWQSVLAWSNLSVSETYKHRVKDTEGFPDILHKNILLGLNNIKTFDKTITSECQAVTPEAARFVFSPRLYTIDGIQHTAHTCDKIYLSVHDKQGGTSVLGFDPLTGVLLSERSTAVIEDKNAGIEIDYGVFKKFNLNFKVGNAMEPKVILIPTSLSIVITIGNQQAATIKLTIKNIETQAAFDPLVFEKPILQ